MVPEGFVRALDGFETVLVATPSDRWLSPSPCEGWCALDVAGHVIAGLLVVEARAAGGPLPEADPDWREAAGEDPVATWRAVRADMMAVLGPDALARRIELALGSELRPVLAGDVPSDGLIRRLAPALNLHEADLFALAWLDVPEDLAPLDHRASWHLPHLAGWAARLPPGRVRALREQVTAMPQEKRTQPIKPPRPYEQFERSATGMLLRLFANRNLGRRDAYTITAVTGRGLSPSTVMMAGHGRKELSPEEWTDYVAVLDISAADLSSVIGFDLPDPLPQRSPAVRETAGLLWEVRRLNSDQARQIRETAEHLHKK